MPRNDKSLLGLLCIIIGILLFIFVVGKFAVQLLAAVISIILINVGLDKLELPSLQVLIFRIFHNIIEKIKKR